jgi:rhamnogalacturonyl hydrolase YesR
MVDMINILNRSIQKLEKWVEDRKYKGYEPFDGLGSKLRPLTMGNLLLDRLLLQLIRQCPVNLRPILGVKPQESTKGRGYMVAGYINMYNLTQDIKYKERAITCLEWLIENKSPKYSNYSWGNHFDFASRGGRYPTYEPIIVWTSLIGHSFLDSYESLGLMQYLNIADSICQWIMELPREYTTAGACLSYLATTQSSIHNSNMLGASMLARTAKLNNKSEYMKTAREAIDYSCARQLSNGAWYYGESENNHWIDNFHTGYNLDSLKCYIDNSDDKRYVENLSRGFKYYINHFIEDSGRPKYYHNRAYPIDSQCSSQTIETLAKFADEIPFSLELGKKVANWVISNMQDGDGFFYYRQYPGIISKTPMMHWAQATTYKALTCLLKKLH